MKIESTKGVLSLDEATLCFNVEAEGESWSWEKDYRPCFLAGEEKVFFSDAASIRHEAVKNGIGNSQPFLPQQRLYFFPLPQGQGSLG